MIIRIQIPFPLEFQCNFVIFADKMFFFLSKVLLFLIKPTVWIAAILIAAIVTKDEFKRKRRLIIATVLFFVLSNNFLVNQAYLMYEDQGTEELDSSYEVGLVLGGFSRKDTFLKRAVFYEANDRLMQAIKLYKEGRIKKIMVSSGSAEVYHQELKEADAVCEYLRDIGIPDSCIIKENQSRNTLENILYSKEILDTMGIKGRVLVFSSAWHLPRVRLCLNNHLDADLYATNQKADQRKDYSAYNLIIPNASALANSEFLLKEWVGYVFYMIKVS